MEAMVTALNYFCRRPAFLPRVRHLRCRRRRRRPELLLPPPDKFRMLIPSFQLFRAATALVLVLIQPPTLVSPPIGRKEGRGKFSLPPLFR